jgi:hypothetical protein
MNGLEFDTSQSGFNAVLKDWQLKAMKVVWASQEGANSRTVWNKVNQALQGETISRASIINFLEAMREMGVISGEEKTGKGGHHWVYFPKLDEAGFKKYIVEKMLEILMRDFPDETRQIIKKL